MAIGINWLNGVWIDATWKAGVWLDTGTVVPNVVGETQAQATIDIQAVGLVVSVTTANSSSVAAGLVISQSPAGGLTVANGSTVTITISLGDAAQPAGRRRRRRYLVEIDGQEFDVNSPDEAIDLLNKAKVLANQIVTEARQSVTVKPGLKIPKIRTPNGELVQVVKQAREEIRDLYAELKRDLEIRFLLARADEDEEEAITRLLM